MENSKDSWLLLHHPDLRGEKKKPGSFKPYAPIQQVQVQTRIADPKAVDHQPPYLCSTPTGGEDPSKALKIRGPQWDTLNKPPPAPALHRTGFKVSLSLCVPCYMFSLLKKNPFFPRKKPTTTTTTTTTKSFLKKKKKVQTQKNQWIKINRIFSI